MEGERTYTLKEAKDLLRHIKEQRLDYREFPPHVETIHTDKEGVACEESMWHFYSELSDQSKFHLLFHILNEHTFKSTVFNLLHMIKSIQYPLMQASFLCLNDHMEHIYNTSLSQLGRSSTSSKTNASSSIPVRVRGTKTLASSSSRSGGVSGSGMGTTMGDHMIELDPSFNWNPETSEYLLQHIVTPSFCGGAGQFPTDIAKLKLMGSSQVCSGENQLGYHTRCLRHQEMRSISVRRTNPSTVEDNIAAMARAASSSRRPLGGQRDNSTGTNTSTGSGHNINQAAGLKKSFQFPGHTTQYPAIVAFSLPAFIAIQLLRGVRHFYHQHLTRVAEAALSSIFSPLSCAPSHTAPLQFWITSPEAEQCFLQMHISTLCTKDRREKGNTSLMVSAAYVNSLWDASDNIEKTALLKTLGFVEDSVDRAGTAPPSSSSKGSAKQSKGKKRSSKGGGGMTGASAELGELLRADFRKFVETLHPPTIAQQEMEPLLPTQSDLSNDWWDIEEGTRDKASLSRFEERIKRHGRENDFELWSVSEPLLGSIMCEYIATCPLEKLFTPTSWNSWSIGAFDKLEKRWLEEETERLLLAYDDTPNTVATTSTIGGSSSSSLSSVDNTSASKKSSKNKSKKQKKAAAAKRKSATIDDKDCNESGSGIVTDKDTDPRTSTETSDQNISMSTNGTGSKLNSRVERSEVLHTVSTKSIQKEDVVPQDNAVDSLPDTIGCDTDSDIRIDPSSTTTATESSSVLQQSSSSDLGEDNTTLPPFLPKQFTEPVVQSDSDKRRESSNTELVSHHQGSSISVDFTERGQTQQTEDNIISLHDNDESDIKEFESLHPSLSSSPHSSPDRITNRKVNAEAHLTPPRVNSTGSSCSTSTTDSETHRSMSTAFSDRSSTTTTTPASSVGTSHGTTAMNCQLPQTLTSLLAQDVQDMAIGLRTLADQRRPWQLGTVEKVKEIAKNIWAHAVVDIFGSFSTGLAIPSSDVDIIISGVAQQMQWYGGRWASPLTILSQQLQMAPWVTTLKTIEKTSMPVIKLTTAPVPIEAKALGSGAVRGIIKLDVSFSSCPPHPHSGQHLPMGGFPVMHQGIATRDFVMKLCAMNHALAPLTLVLKQFLSEHGLHDPYTGGLTSYAVTIMVASILQPYVLEPPNTHPDLGTLLLMFFKKFGTSFDTRKYAVALTVNGPFVPLTGDMMPRVGSKGYWNPPDPVVVIDPLNAQNNLGRSCFGFRQLQLTFDSALEAAVRSLGQENESSAPPLTSILGVMFGAGHHKSVLKLVSRLWCPNEIPDDVGDTTGENMNDQDEKESSNLANVNLSAQDMRERCVQLLTQMSGPQLEIAHQGLLHVLQQSQGEEHRQEESTGNNIGTSSDSNRKYQRSGEERGGNEFV